MNDQLYLQLINYVARTRFDCNSYNKIRSDSLVDKQIPYTPE